MGESVDAGMVNRKLTDMLVECGRRAGLRPVTEYAVSGGRIDVVWLWEPPTPIPGVEAGVPVVGFEIESSWRTRKHIKGDMVNLLDAGCALGVIVCAGDTDKDAALRRFASSLVDRPGPTILIWSADEVEALRRGEVMPPVVAPVPTGASPQDHMGKYRPLWQWLRSRSEVEIDVTFAEVEDAMGMPLPPSCRRHLAHWYGYEGSAVARAVRDAGWRAKAVDLTQQTVSFERST